MFCLSQASEFWGTLHFKQHIAIQWMFEHLSLPIYILTIHGTPFLDQNIMDH